MATVWCKIPVSAGSTITVTGIDGRIVAEHTTRTPVTKAELHLKNAATGLYLITVDSKKRTVIKVMTTE